jgi:hypothetical protein
LKCQVEMLEVGGLLAGIPKQESAMAEEQKLPKHHYIPVLYLSQWVDGDGRLYEFSRPNGRSEVSARPTGPKGTGYERGLYRLTGVPDDVSEAVERKFMAQVDSLAKKTLDVLLGEDTPAWTVPSRSAWSRFVTGLIFRNPERVRESRRFLEDFWLRDYDERVEEYNRQKAANGPDFIDYIASSAERVGLRFTMDQIDNTTIGTRINEMEWWTIDVTSVGRKLFTSDRPVILEHGLAHPHSYLLLPISPTRIFLATNTREQANNLRAIPPRQLVKSVNKHIIRRAQRYGWGTDKSELSFVKKHLSQEAHLDMDFFRTVRRRLASGDETGI